MMYLDEFDSYFGTFYVHFEEKFGYIKDLPTGKFSHTICDKEHDDGAEFDTLGVCRECTPDIRLQPNIYTLRKMLRRFEYDPMAFRNRKQILLEYMQKYAHKTDSDYDYLYYGMPKGTKKFTQPVD